MVDGDSSEQKIDVNDATIAPATDQSRLEDQREDRGPSTIQSQSSRNSADTDSVGRHENSAASDPGQATSDGRVPSAPQERPIPVVDGYEILGELGRGGMGIVYRAREVRLNRPCALKMILAGAHADAEAGVRFLAEAEAVARLQHPNIVQIHRIDSSEGLPFFELEYVEGGSLDQRLDGTPWPARRVAEFIEPLVRGVAEAHRLEIVHRDLKPANVLLASDDAPKITDFGLAKSLNLDSGLTKTDSIMGSPNYMAPEQAEGNAKEVGPLADVYSLGAIMYELLTGRPPFKAATLLETLEQVKRSEPVQPARLAPGIPRDIETIALKCLQKEPGKRYDSATALADDLRRYLDNVPIVARPVPQWERVVKWARRRPAIATLVVVVHLLLAALLCLGIWSYARINQSLMVAREERERAIEQTNIAERRAEALAWEDYINRVNRAYREVQDDNIALAEDLLQGCPNEHRGWEWNYVYRLCHSERLALEAPAGSVCAVAFSPDGKLIASASGGHFSKATVDSNFDLWDRATGIRRPIGPPTENVRWSVAFSPDGTMLALGGSNPQLEVRDVSTGAILWSKHDPELPQAMAVAFSPDGKSIATGFGVYSGIERAFEVRVFDAATGRTSVTFPGPPGGVNDLAFHADGRRLFVTGSGVVDMWDVPERRKIHEIPGHSKWVYAVASSPDGKWLATGGWDRTIKLRDAATGKEQLTIFGHEGFVLDLAFGPDSKTLASTSEDRSVRLWEIPTGRSIGVFHGHADFVQAVAFAPNGRELASGGMEGRVHVWNLRTSLPVVFTGHTGWVGRLWYRRDGRRVVSLAVGYQVPGETTKGWDPRTGEPDPTLDGVKSDDIVDEFIATPPKLPPTTTSHDGKLGARVVQAVRFEMADRSKEYANRTVELVDMETGRQLHTLLGHAADVTAIAFSPDDERVATSSYDKTIKLWDTVTGREVLTLRGHTAGVNTMAFSPGGHRIVTGGIDFTARVWDATPLPSEVQSVHEKRYRKKVAALEKEVRAALGRGRAEQLAREGLWTQAADAFAKVIESHPNDAELHRRLVLSLLMAGDRTGAARACKRVLDRFGSTINPLAASQVALSSLVAPNLVADKAALLRLAETSQGWNMSHARGAALYRSGEFSDAIRDLMEDLQIRGHESPQFCAFLAMAHHRLGNADDAERWLEKLRANEPAEGEDFSWNNVEIRILRREAESLIIGSGTAVPKTHSDTPAENGGGNRAK